MQGSGSEDGGGVQLTETITAQPALALAGLLDVDPPASDVGDALPPLWHLVYLLPRPAQSSLGADGHPLDGVPPPPRGESRRMFGGARVIHRWPVRVGEPAVRHSRVVGERSTQGGGGRLSIVTVRTTISQAGRVAVEEEQEILYRESTTGRPTTSAPERVPTTLPGPAVGSSLMFDVDPVVLFRFSALTYNAHRIHYDREYAALEGYPDLVVHGPLQALLMAECARRRGATFTDHVFAYRLRAPAVGPQRLQVECREDGGGRPASWTMSVRSASGVDTATATLRPA